MTKTTKHLNHGYPVNEKQKHNSTATMTMTKKARPPTPKCTAPHLNPQKTKFPKTCHSITT
jgi:hypothetical protein